MPKVSVVMPVYNSEEYLREAIDSIISQTFTDWEFIIVNEYGSNKAATDILAEYAAMDPRIIVIQNKKRLGIAESLNVGLQMAKGEYIARMDGDDLSMPERLQRQVEYLDTHLDIDLCGSYISDVSGNKLDWQLELNSGQIYSDIIFFSPCVHPTIMFRARLIEKMHIEYSSDFVASEDYDFFEKICSVGKIINLPQILLCYRLHSDNATERNRNIGANLYKQVMNRVFIKMGLTLSAEDLSLLSPHECMKGAQGKEILKRLVRLDQLLKKILLTNEKKCLFSKRCLAHTLYKRMRDAKDSISWACQDIDWRVIDNFYNNSMFHHSWFVETDYQDADTVLENPLVTVLLPTYNSEAYIADTIDSVLRQTFTNFEVLIINEYGSTDATLDFVNVFNDNRISVIQNQHRLGLAESLNLGLREARGKYVARIDADDICSPERFAKQVDFLEKNPDYGLCGSWQHHFGADTDMVHEVPIKHADLQAQLLYRCELCHSTLMLRRSVFVDNNLFYDASCAAEDYELWTRAVYKTKFANLPEVLGGYRVGDTNITAKKIELLSEESAQICARLLHKHLDIKVSEEHLPFLSSWINEFNNIHNPQRLQKQLVMEKKLLCLMWNQNEKLKVYEQSAFLYVINKRWRWVTNTWTYGTPLGEIFELDELFKKYPMPDNVVKSSFHLIRFYLYKIIKKLLKIVIGPLYRPIKNRLNARFEQLQRQIWDTEGHLKDNQAKIFNDLKLWQEQVVEGNIEAIIDDKLRHIYEQVNQNLDLKLFRSEQIINRDINNRIGESEHNISQRIDGRIWQAEQKINQTLDSRIWQAEKNINQQTDSRIWQAEQGINEKTDARIWQAEQSINEKTNARIWQAEQGINEKTDARIWQAEQNINQTTDGRIWKAEENVLKKQDDNKEQILDETHRHIDFTYRDVMIALQQQKAFLPESNIKLQTDYPIAYESLDHLYPHGTIRDNTRYPRFVEKCEELLLPKKDLAFLDLGCSGGGMVLEAALRGHISMGLEGSDCSKKEQRAEWRLLGDRLQTCDITKPFYLRKPGGDIQQFDVITAWEVLEHIAETDLPQLFENIKNHLTSDGYFVGSIANWDDIDPVSGVNWHVTVHPYEWWVKEFSNAGFKVQTEKFNTIDLARGGYNHPQCYLKPAEVVYTETSFHIAVQK